MANDAGARAGRAEPAEWHALEPDAVLARLGSSPEGLTGAEAAARRQRFGPNALAGEKRQSVIGLALHHLATPVTYVLLAAIAASLLTNNFIDAAAIAVVVVLNTVLGVISEWRAEQALTALEKLAAPRARVVRDGRAVMVPAAEIVPGDLLALEAGDRVGADARLVAAEELQTDESALTGESEPVTKTVAVLPGSVELADRTNMVWLSTVVTGGRGRAVVTATGMDTALGTIAAQMRRTRRPQTRLQVRINRLAAALGFVAVGLGGVLFGIGMLRGYPVLEMMLFSVAAAVSSVPAGLPAAVSVTLALGVRRMAQRNAIVRRLAAVETLGSTTVICSDKTGTLTQNQMSVARAWAAGEEAEPPFAGAGGGIAGLMLAGALASNTTISGSGPDAVIEGSATEKAIVEAARAAGIDVAAARAEHVRLAEVPFSSSRKFMAVLVAMPGGGRRVYLKGAPERVLARCRRVARAGTVAPLDEEALWEVRDAIEQFAARALRVVAAAYRDLPPGADRLDEENLGDDFVLLGLWGMVDPPRPEAEPAVRAARGAGVRVLMVTGDHAATAEAIGRQVGIADSGHDAVITGGELDRMDEAALRERLAHVAVFARVTPAHKLAILRALQGRGEVVAMTGDGVNDGPALKAADIGVAMGRAGTEVAKEAADMVLTDDNFATIVRAIEEGRVIFHNLRRVVTYLVATSLGEMLTFATCIFAGLGKPLTPVMVLWVNLVTDGACTIPLGIEPGHGDVLSEPPRPPSERLVNVAMVRRIVLLALTMAAGVTVQFWLDSRSGSVAHARTYAFTTLVAFQWFQALTMRSSRTSLLRLGLGSNRPLLLGVLVAIVLQLLVIYTPVGPLVFGTVPLGPADWLRIVALAGSILVIDELRKLIGRRRGKAVATRLDS